MPPAPTAMADEAPVTAMSYRVPVVTPVEDHVSPPSVVLRRTPSAPTATPRNESKNATEFKLSAVPVGTVAHVCPPSVVRTNTPPSPTAKPDTELTNCTALRFVNTPLFSVTQVLPPSGVMTIVPFAPTAQPSNAACAGAVVPRVMERAQPARNPAKVGRFIASPDSVSLKGFAHAMGELAQESTIRAEETFPIEPIDYGSPDRCALWMCNPRRRSPLATS